MNTTEGNKVNVLLRYFLAVPPIPSHEQAQEAAEYLADRSHKALFAEMQGKDVADAWPALELWGVDEP